VGRASSAIAVNIRKYVVGGSTLRKHMLRTRRN